MKNLKELAGWHNRHTHPLPKEECHIKVMVIGDKDHTQICLWKPTGEDYGVEEKYKGYIGSAYFFSTSFSITPRTLSYNVWEQTDYDFIYYQVL